MQREFWSDTGRTSGDGKRLRRFLPTPDANAGGRWGQNPERINPLRTFTINDAVRAGTLTSSAADPPARLYLLPAPEEVSKMIAGCGRSFAELSDSSDPDTYWLKTSQGCYQRLIEWDDEAGCLEEYSETWPRSGTMHSGTAYRLPPLVPRISGTECSSLPTPNKWDGQRGAESRATKRKRGSGGVNLREAVKTWPTPKATDAENSQQSRSLNGRAGGQLNPTFVEWLMGFETGFTDLDASEKQ